MDNDYDYYVGDKSTDDFYNYNSRDFDERVNQDVWNTPLGRLTIQDMDDMITEWD